MKSDLPTTLKYMRHERGITQRALAQETGLSLSAIIQYEKGKCRPNFRAMEALQRYFNVDGSYFLGGAKEGSSAAEKPVSAFFEHVDKLCIEHGISISRFTREMLGLSPASATQWKNGAYPNSSIVIATARYFGVSTDFLLGVQDTQPMSIENEIPEPAEQEGEHMADYSGRIKALRNALGMTQADFAEALGIGQSHLSAIERGEKNASKGLRLLLIKTFNIRREWLESGVGGMFEPDGEIASHTRSKVIIDDHTTLVDLEREKAELNTSLKRWALTHTSEEDQCIVADMQQLLLLTESTSFKAGRLYQEALEREE